MVSPKAMDERMEILRMIEEHRITADQGALLLAGVKPGMNGISSAVMEEKMDISAQKADQPKEPESQPTSKMKARYFKVRVTDLKSGRAKVNVTLPLSLVKWGLQFSKSHVAEVNGFPIEDLGEMIDSGIEGKFVDVEDIEDGEHVEIFIE